MPTDNERLVVILGQADFSAGLSDRINTSRKAIEEPAIAVALAVQNREQLGGAEKYYAAHPDSRVTVLHGRAYTDYRRIIGQLQALGQKIIFVAEVHNGQTQKTAEALAHELGVDQVVIETSGNLHRHTVSAITRLLGLKANPDAGYPEEDAEDSAAKHTLRSSTRRQSSAAAPPKAKPHSKPAAHYQTDTLQAAWAQHPSLPTTDFPDPPVPPNRVNGSTKSADPNGQPTPVRLHSTDEAPATALITVEGVTKWPTPCALVPSTRRFIPSDAGLLPKIRKETLMSTGSTDPESALHDSRQIEATLKELQAFARDNLAQIHESVRRLRETVAWLSQLEATSTTLREEINAQLAGLPADLVSPQEPDGGTLASPPAPARSASSGNEKHAGNGAGHTDGHSKTYSLGYGHTIALSGTRARQLFEILVDPAEEAGKSYTREMLEHQLQASAQVVYQAVADLRRQLRESLGTELAEQCLRNTPHSGYRWDVSALVPH